MISEIVETDSLDEVTQGYILKLEKYLNSISHSKIMVEHKKKEIMLKGIGLHLGVYVLISILLWFLNVPANLIFVIFMVLLWGLFVLSYAFYYEKK